MFDRMSPDAIGKKARSKKLVTIFYNYRVLRPLHTTHATAKIFLKKVGEKIVAHIKTVEKIVAAVKRICSVYGR